MRLTPHYLLTRIAMAAGPGNGLVFRGLSAMCESRGCRLSLAPAYIEIRKDDRSIRIARSHFVYALDIAERFEAHFCPVAPQEVEGLSTVDYSRPALHTFRSGRSFWLTSFPEDDAVLEAYFMHHTPSMGDLAYDIGANCGLMTLRLSRHVGESGMVIAFEPDPLNYEFLVRNVELHALANVTAVPCAVSDVSGPVQFNCEGALGSAISAVCRRSSLAGAKSVRSITLAEAFAQYGVPSFCKVDIEGAEVRLIQSSRDMIRDLKIHFALDTNHRVGRSTTTDLAVELAFSEAGYISRSDSVNGMKTTWAWPS